MKFLPSPGALASIARNRAIRALIEPLEQRILLSAAATGLTATAASNSTVNLSWTINKGGGVLVDFLIERSLTSTGGFSIVHGVSGTTSTFQDTGLTAGTTYFYEVVGQVFSDTLQSSNPSNIASVATTNVPAPAAPSNLIATAVTNSQIDLSWTNHASNQTSFLLQRATDAAFTKNLITLGTTAVALDNSGLSPSTTYFYRVAAVGNGGDSAFSTAASAATPAVTTANGSLVAASNLIVTNNSSSSVSLAWDINTDLGATLLFFQVQRSLNGSTGWTPISTVSPTTANDQDTTVANSTTYFYRVEGVFLTGNNQIQLGAPSNVVLTTT